MSPSKEQEDSISHMCQQLTMGLSQLSSDDAFGTTQRVESTPSHNLTSPAFQAPSPRHTNETSKQDQNDECGKILFSLTFIKPISPPKLFLLIILNTLSLLIFDCICLQMIKLSKMIW